MTRVILIHGTWANDATWVATSSPLAKRLLSEFPHFQVADPFRWSGENNFQARHRAAAELVDRLRSESGDGLILVAHSHGGSVVHYAYKDAPELFKDRVLGVACMATPFFGFSLRPGYGALTAAFVAVVGIVLLHLLMALGMAMNHWFRLRSDLDMPFFLTVAAIVLPVLVGMVGGLLRVRRGIYDWLAAGAERLARWETVMITLPHAAFFRSMGDEVALGLSTGQFLTTLANRTLGALAGCADWAVGKVIHWCRTKRGKLALGGIAVLVLVAAGVPPALHFSLGLRPEDVWLLLWIVPGCGIEGYVWVSHLLCAGVQLAIWLDLLLMLLSLLLLTVALLGWLASLLILRLFGVWSATAAIAAELAIEPVPEGAHSFCNTGWSRDVASLRFGRRSLQHSEPYSSEGAQTAICAWIRSLSVAEVGHP